jgi:hybrid cluster-associated redox disulfide protein
VKERAAEGRERGNNQGGGMINKEMTIAEIVRRYPETLAVFEKYRLDCFECQIAEYEALEHGADVHKINVGQLLDELNAAIRKTV